MFSLPKFTTAKEIQKNYRQIFDGVKKTGEPVIIMKNNQPDVAIIDMKKFEEFERMEAIRVVLESREEARKGKTKILKSFKDLR